MDSYDVRVRGAVPMYLWGSKSVTHNLNWPLLLSLRNDVAGDPVEIHSETANGNKSLIGTLQAGECYTLPLLGLRGVFATCDVDSNVSCAILLPHLGP
jgi:hypothetical protein